MQTTPPYMIGQVWKFENQQKLEGWARGDEKYFVLLEGYRVVVSWYGELEEQEWKLGDRFTILNQMADFYYENRIKNYGPGFARYKI